MVDAKGTNAAGGDGSDIANWFPAKGGPPQNSDNTTFNDLATSYTVTVRAGETNGISKLSPSISIDAASAVKDMALSISGALTGNFVTTLGQGGAAASLTIEPDGALIAPELLFSVDVFETVTISRMDACRYLELDDVTVGGFVSGKNSLMVLNFAYAGPTALNTSVIQIDNIACSAPVHASQTITSVGLGDPFVIKRANFIDDTVLQDTATNELMVMNRATTAFTLDNVFLSAGAANRLTIVNGGAIEATQIACYVRGTMIRTQAGERAVERLRPGMPVITLIDGVVVPRTVKWVGHRRIDLTRHPRPDVMAPIRVERDAFADDVPRRDLLLSPDHAVFVKGMLICVGQLVNGATIRKERGWTAVDYYHVELDRHAIVLAEGLTVESYLDTGNRGFFANSGRPPVLHPDLPNEKIFPSRADGSCAPFVTDEANVRPVWRGLSDRAAAIGRAAPIRATTTEAGPRLQSSVGLTIEPSHRDNDHVIFHATA